MGLARAFIALPWRSGASDVEVAAQLPGDDLLPDATDVVDRCVTLDALPDQVWPWLVQLGKGRGGWYLPQRLEVLLPRRRRGLRCIDASLQGLVAGDEVPDWGPGRPVFRTITVDPTRALVYLSLRDKANGHRWPTDDRRDRRGVLAFSWALVLTDAAPGQSRLHLRLRMRLAPSRVPTAVIGGLFDWLTVRLLFRGLRERLR